MFFKILWAIDAISTLVILCFLFIGLADGTVNGQNMGLWSLIVIVCAAVLGGSYWLRKHQYPGFAIVVALILVLPALAFLLCMLIGINSKWN